MKKFAFVVPVLLLSAVYAIAQSSPSESTPAKSVPSYQKGTLVKMTADVRTQTNEILHGAVSDSMYLNEKIVTYHFVVRSGSQSYVSKYTPEQQPAAALPHPWWQGNMPVQIKLENRTLHIKSSDGVEVASKLVSQVPPSK